MCLHAACMSSSQRTSSSRPGEDKDQLGKVESLAKKLLRRVTQDGAGRRWATAGLQLGYSWSGRDGRWAR